MAREIDGGGDDLPESRTAAQRGAGDWKRERLLLLVTDFLDGRGPFFPRPELHLKHRVRDRKSVV